MGRKVIGIAKRIDPTRSWPRRWRVLMSLVVIAAVGVTFVQTVLAVHEDFELDGNTRSGDATTPVGNLPNIDWDQIINANGTAKPAAQLPTGFSHAGFEKDFLQNANGSFNTADATTYATGSKDVLPISGWQCTRSNNVTSKDDILNAYAAAFKNSEGDDVLYFGLERDANNGDANIGFWFLQSDVNCLSPGGSTDFAGGHQDGDLFIVSAFSNGGDVSTINVYRWNGDDETGFLGTTPVASGVDCRNDTVTAGDTNCAAANRLVLDGATAIPWLTSNSRDGVGHKLREGEFFEGGLNLTDAGLGGKCFNVFIGNTRSSTSLTATIFDYARGLIGECTSTTVTTPSINGNANPMQIPTGGTVSVTDSALVTVDGVDTFSGTVDFFLCGPNATQILCATGGVPAGTKSITNADAEVGGTVVSNTMTVTAVGHYCWRAEFTAEAGSGVPDSQDARQNECFQITPRTATLDTLGGGPVNFGQPVTDTATLANTANKKGSGGPAGSTDLSINPGVAGGPAGGTIQFTLYKANCTTLATGTGTNPQSVTVIGNGSYGPVTFTPDAPGTYHWKAVYTSNDGNTIGTEHNSACNDSDETVVVSQIPTNIKSKQGWIPNDTATVTSTIGNLAAGGSVQFSLYANATCTGTAVFSQNVSVPSGSPSAEVSTTNTTFVITTDYTDPASSTKGKYSWKIVYTPAAADTAHTGKQSACDAENFTIAYRNDPGPGTNLP